MSAVPAMSLAEFTARGIEPAMQLLPSRMDSPPARIQLLAIALQESRLMHRRQIILVADHGEMVLRPLGPAKSYFMGEQGGGLVHGVRVHPITRDIAAEVYRARQVVPTERAIWNAIEHDDVLACALARLLIYLDPRPLPAVGDAEGAWGVYMRQWRPGRPRRDSWDAIYRRAMSFVMTRDL